MANSEYNYIPTYIRRTINNRPKDVVTAKYWNELFNLLITQGDHTAEELGNILNYFSTRLVGVESEIAESAEAIANIRGAFRINVTSSNGVYSADKTFEEIKAAYDARLLPFVVYGGDTIYTLSFCYFASEHMFMDFERYLIGEDMLETEMLRIYSYVTDSGSNIARRTEEFNVPSGATYIAVDATGDAISTVNGETYADIQALIDAGKPVVVRWDDLGDFYYFETFEFSDSSGIHRRLNFRCVIGDIVYTLSLKDDNTWFVSMDSLQSKSITDIGGYYTTDTVEGALQEIGAGLALKADKSEIPTALPNPHKLTINGTEYDGSVDVQMTIQGGGGTSDHSQLTNRDAANQHPITAITGLQTALDSKADAADIPSLEGYATEAYVQNYHDNTKQDIITDLATIRSGASNGATAVQPEAGKGLFSGNYGDLTNKPTIPTALPNPHKLTINGTEYDGSADVQMTIQCADGKSAYEYAVEGGYTRTEAEFAEKLAQEQLTGTANDITPTQVYDAVSAGIPVKVQYTDSTYGLLSFTAFNVAESLNVIVSQTIVYYNGVYILAELVGSKSNNSWGFNTTMLAEKKDIPDIPAALPNPNALTFTGAVAGSYDGSAAMTVNIPSAVTDAHINSLIDTKLGVIENGAY